MWRGVVFAHGDEPLTWEIKSEVAGGPEQSRQPTPSAAYADACTEPVVLTSDAADLTALAGHARRLALGHRPGGRGATLRRELINIPARLAHRGPDHLILHLPQDWPWQDGFGGVFDVTHRAPPTRAA